MDKKKILLEDIGKVNPFRAPEGYFESLTNSIMSQLPDIVDEKTVTVNMWQKVRPWVYMAAMLAGVALVIRLFVGVPTRGLNLTSSLDFEDYYQYYKDGLDNLAYKEAFYLTDDAEEAYSE